jgi:hypothetical protein
MLILVLYYSVLSVKGNKVLHIDRNDHYGGWVDNGAPQQRHVPNQLTMTLERRPPSTLRLYADFISW